MVGNSPLKFRQKIFLKYFCYPLPGRDHSADPGTNLHDYEPLATLLNSFGNEFKEDIQNKVVLDVGCGCGDQVLGVVLAGARMAVGSEIRPIYYKVEEKAKELGMTERVRFILGSIRVLGQESVDLLFSQNSFEHVGKPEEIMEDAFFVLRKGGRFFVTFAPPWLNPFGIHMFFMIKYPWSHFVFSENTIMQVRKLYRSDGADTFSQSEGGLNKMTIKRFIKLGEEAGFRLSSLDLTPIRPLPKFLTTIGGVREFVTSRVSAILSK